MRNNGGTCHNELCALAEGHQGDCDESQAGTYCPATKSRCTAPCVGAVCLRLEPGFQDRPAPKREYNHYFKDVSKFQFIDVYRVIDLWAVTDPCLQHAIKKLLCAGQRGSKDMTKDIKEVIASCERWLQMQSENQS